MASYLRRSPDADELEEGVLTPCVLLNDEADALSAARQFAGAFEVEKPNEEVNDSDDEPADDSAPLESEVVEEDQLDAPEVSDEYCDDGNNSFQNTATLMIGEVTEPAIETDSKMEVEKVEVEAIEVTVEEEQNENTNESTDDNSAPPSALAKRAPLTRNFTQTSVAKNPARNDESDWAWRNQGRNKVLGLIAKFSNPSSVSNATVGYKTEHGIAQVGQIKQSKFQ